MKITDFLKQYDKERNYPDFILCYTKEYSLILLPYVYGLPLGIVKEKNSNWKVFNSTGSASSSKKIKHNIEFVNRFAHNNENYLSTGNVFITDEKCLISVFSNHEFGTAQHYTYNQLLNIKFSDDDVELFPPNRYLCELYEFYINDYKYYFALSRDQFNHDLLMIHYFSIEKEFEIKLLSKDCDVFNTYRDGGTMEISFKDCDVYLPTPFDKEAIPKIKIMNVDYDMVKVTDENVLKNISDHHLKLNKKLK